MRAAGTLSKWAALLIATLLCATAHAQTRDLQSAREQCRGSKDLHVKAEACSFVIGQSRARAELERAHNSRGHAYLGLKRFADAVSDFTQVIKFNGSIAGYFDNRRHAYFGMGQLDLALQDASTAIRLAPKHAFVYVSRALIYKELRSFESARSDFTTAMSLDPSWVGLNVERGIVYVKMGRLDAAIADFNRAIELDGNFTWAFRERGLTHLLIGQREKALADLSVALRADPDDKEVIVALRELSAGPPPAAQPRGRRVALIIGNSKYLHKPSLNNPLNDAQMLASTLRSTGFQSVAVKTDLSREQIIAALREFATVADGADWAVVYYSGHGIEFGGINYLIPVDAMLKADRDIDLEAVDVGKVLSAIDGAAKLRLLILDACRDNPFLSQMRRTAPTRSLNRGLARIEPEAGTLIVYAAKHGEVALDGDGPTSPFAGALVKRLNTPNLEVRRLFDLVRDDVIDVTKRKQQPFSYGSLSGREEFFFVSNR
jgi:tetratricopeptide (TPR) repeat protein